MCRRDAPIASRTAVWPRRAHRAREQQVRDVGAGDQQHQPADAEENLQAAAVLLFHDADAGAGRHDRDDLLGQRLDDRRHPVRRVAGVVLHPLVEDAGQARTHAVGRRARAQPADHAQPRGDRLPQDRRVAVDQRLLLQRNPEIGRIAAQRFAEESRRRDADDGERVPFDDERGADDRRIAAVGAPARRGGSCTTTGGAAGASSSAVKTRPPNAPTPSVEK